MAINIKPIPKLAPLYTIGIPGVEDLTGNNEYIILEGGRAGGKSETLAQTFVLLSRVQKHVGALCTREIQKSMEHSVYKMLEDWIREMDLQSEFYFTKTSIINKFTGFFFVFMGMEAATRSDSLKSLKNIKYVWYEEAQTATFNSLKKLTPTIRINGRKIIFTMNRETHQDAVIEYFKSKKKVLNIKINYIDNQYCPQTSIEEAEELKILDYKRYCHEWMGIPREDDSSRVVLPYEWLTQCIDLHKKWDIQPAKKIGGFDVAEGILDQHDKNSLVVRSGPVVTSRHSWRIDQIYKSVAKIDGFYNELGFDSLFFDANAIGAGAKGDFERLAISHKYEGKLPYHVIPTKGSQSPGGKDKTFVKHGRQKVTNGMMFKNLKSQMWWNIRLRLENSLRLIKVMKIDRPEYFISFSSDIPDLESILRELSQATYDYDSSGRILIDKAPGERTIEDPIDGKKKKRKSPNDADGVCLAFSGDCRSGLRPGKSVSLKARVIK